jgi:hypothetical protein
MTSFERVLLLLRMHLVVSTHFIQTAFTDFDRRFRDWITRDIQVTKTRKSGLISIVLLLLVFG